MENRNHSQNMMSLQSIVKLKTGNQRVSGNILKSLKGTPTPNKSVTPLKCDKILNTLKQVHVHWNTQIGDA